MKQAITTIALLSLVLLASTAMAEKQNPGQEVINLKMGIMVLPLKHWKHQQDLNNECFHCHSKGTPGKIDGWGEKKAHIVCVGCHDLESKGPTECKQCHKK